MVSGEIHFFPFSMLAIKFAAVSIWFAKESCERFIFFLARLKFAANKARTGLRSSIPHPIAIAVCCRWMGMLRKHPLESAIYICWIQLLAESRSFLKSVEHKGERSKETDNCVFWGLFSHTQPYLLLTGGSSAYYRLIMQYYYEIALVAEDKFVRDLFYRVWNKKSLSIIPNLIIPHETHIDNAIFPSKQPTLPALTPEQGRQKNVLLGLQRLYDEAPDGPDLSQG